MNKIRDNFTVFCSIYKHLKVKVTVISIIVIKLKIKPIIENTLKNK